MRLNWSRKYICVSQPSSAIPIPSLGQLSLKYGPVLMYFHVGLDWCLWTCPIRKSYDGIGFNSFRNPWCVRSWERTQASVVKQWTGWVSKCAFTEGRWGNKKRKNKFVIKVLSLDLGDRASVSPLCLENGRTQVKLPFKCKMSRMNLFSISWVLGESRSFITLMPGFCHINTS